MRISLILFLRKIHAVSFVVASLSSRWISQISFLIMFQVSKDTWSLIRTRSISGLYLFTMREEDEVMSRLHFVDPSRRKGSSCRVNTRRRPSNYSSRSTIWSSPRFFSQTIVTQSGRAFLYFDCTFRYKPWKLPSSVYRFRHIVINDYISICILQFSEIVRNVIRIRLVQNPNKSFCL